MLVHGDLHKSNLLLRKANNSNNSNNSGNSNRNSDGNSNSNDNNTIDTDCIPEIMAIVDFGDAISGDPMFDLVNRSIPS